jgi:hypothetical protein
MRQKAVSGFRSNRRQKDPPYSRFGDGDSK